MKKTILIAIIICLLGGFGVYKYIDISQGKNFTISEVEWDGEGKLWSDNTMGNKYNVRFGFFDGKHIKTIRSKKSSYDIKINSKIKDGDLNIKIYDGKKILFNKNGTLDETITISNSNNKDIKIEVTGEKAKSGYVKLKAM